MLKSVFCFLTSCHLCLVSSCDKSFFEAKDLQQHMNKHMGLKPFQCQVCGKCYSWKKDWYSHVKSHSVAEPYRYVALISGLC